MKLSILIIFLLAQPKAIIKAPETAIPGSTIILDARDSVSSRPLIWRSDTSLIILDQNDRKGVVALISDVKEGDYKIKLIARTDDDADADIITIKVASPSSSPSLSPSPSPQTKAIFLFDSRSKPIPNEILSSKKIHAAFEKNKIDWRVWDYRSDITNESVEWQKAFRLALMDQLPLPKIVIIGKDVKSFPLTDENAIANALNR